MGVDTRFDKIPLSRVLTRARLIARLSLEF